MRLYKPVIVGPDGHPAVQIAKAFISIVMQPGQTEMEMRAFAWRWTESLDIGATSAGGEVAVMWQEGAFGALRKVIGDIEYFAEWDEEQIPIPDPVKRWAKDHRGSVVEMNQFLYNAAKAGDILLQEDGDPSWEETPADRVCRLLALYPNADDLGGGLRHIFNLACGVHCHE